MTLKWWEDASEECEEVEDKTKEKKCDDDESGRKRRESGQLSSSPGKRKVFKKKRPMKIDVGSDSDIEEVAAHNSSIKVREILDKEKPSTSKKVVAELKRNKRVEGRKSKNRLGADESAMRHNVLDDSSSNDDSEEKEGKDKKEEKKTATTTKKKKREDFSIGPITEQDLKKYPQLAENIKPVVEVVRLAPEIEAELDRNKFIIWKEDADNGDIDSDSSVVGLDKAIRDLHRFDARKSQPNTERKQKSRPKSKKAPENKEDKEKSDEDTLLMSLDGSGAEQDSPDRPQIKLKSMKDLLETENVSDMENLTDKEEDDDEGNKKSKKKSSSKDKKDDRKVEKSTKKKTITPNVELSSSGNESEKADRKNALGKDSDDTESEGDFDKSKSKTPKRKKKTEEDNDEDNDSDVISRRKNRSKKAKLKVNSDDSDNDADDDKKSHTSSKGSKSDHSDDSDFVKKPKKKKGNKRSQSTSDEGSSDGAKKKKKKKQRKRIKQEKDSDDDDGGSSVKTDDSDCKVVPHSQKRKDIRKIMKDKDLKKSTKEAEKEEEERKRRVIERQKKYNGEFDSAPMVDGKVKSLVLEYDAETKEPLIQVDDSIVDKLKPHQADGIRFMYTTCFESVEQINKGKAGGCILAHCMGLGKTLQTVAFTHAMLEYKEITKVKTVLIVCPLNTVGNWLKEYKMWLEEIAPSKMPKLHSLWEGKKIIDRVTDLKIWQRRGGVGIMHYDFFRLLVANATGKGRQKTKADHRKVIEETLLDPGPDIVVCDEGHLLKNHKSKLSEALSRIRTIRRIVLTGTPLQNNLIEYHTMVNFVKPNLLGSLKEFQNRFVNPIKNGQCKDSDEHDVKIMKRRAHVLHSKLDGCVQRLDYSVLTPYLPAKYEYCIIIKLSDKQKDLYRDYLTNKVPTDTVDRGRQILTHYATFIKILAHPIVLKMASDKEVDKEDDDDEEGSLKDFICDDDAEDADETSTTNAEESDDGSNSGSDGDKKKKEKQQNNKRKTRSSKKEDGDDDEDYKLPELPQESLGNKWWASHFETVGDMYDTKLSGKLVVLQEILKICESIGDRVLVFSQYLSTLDIIEEFLAEWDKQAVAENEIPRTFPETLSAAASVGRWRWGVEYFRIDGSTKTIDRQKNCEIFNKKSASRAKLFLISTKAGGLGINLFGANRVVIFDASWNPSNDMQSIFRVYRFGQQKPCYIYRFVAEATMEEKIYNRQVVKLSLSSRVVDEHQVERHFKFDDINEMYNYNPDENSQRPTPPVPKDTLLADLLVHQKEWIISYFEHDTLLVNKEDETLTEEERKQAWDEYTNESENRRVPVPNINAQDMQTYMRIQQKLVERFPNASPEQINASALIVLTKIQELRGLIHKLNYEGPMMAEHPRIQLDEKIKKLQLWISQALGGSLNNDPPIGNGFGATNQNGYAYAPSTVRQQMQYQNTEQTRTIQNQMLSSGAIQQLQMQQDPVRAYQIQMQMVRAQQLQNQQLAATRAPPRILNNSSSIAGRAPAPALRPISQVGPTNHRVTQNASGLPQINFGDVPRNNNNSQVNTRSVPALQRVTRGTRQQQQQQDQTGDGTSDAPVELD